MFDKIKQFAGQYTVNLINNNMSREILFIFLCFFLLSDIFCSYFYFCMLMLFFYLLLFPYSAIANLAVRVSCKSGRA